jgi:hypothetical protein
MPTNLTDRYALCDGCNHCAPSSPTLPDFEYRPDSTFDRYYCGCQNSEQGEEL